jgi:hypothetical protein
MVAFKMSPLRMTVTPFKNIMRLKGKGTVRRQFPHISCGDEEVLMYFRDGLAAKEAMSEICDRSWEYQAEFATEMARLCKLAMGSDLNMQSAYEFYEQWYTSLQRRLIVG